MTHSREAEGPATEHGMNTYRDGTEGTEPILVRDSDTTPYQLWSVPRWNKDLGIVENIYEVLNSTTRVVESRLRTNIVTAASVFETIEELYKEYKAAGSARAMDDNAPVAGATSEQTH